MLGNVRVWGSDLLRNPKVSERIAGRKGSNLLIKPHVVARVVALQAASLKLATLAKLGGRRERLWGSAGRAGARGARGGIPRTLTPRPGRSPPWGHVASPPVVAVSWIVVESSVVPSRPA